MRPLPILIGKTLYITEGEFDYTTLLELRKIYDPMNSFRNPTFLSRVRSMLQFLSLATDRGRKSIPNPKLYMFEVQILDYLFERGLIRSTNKHRNELTLVYDGEANNILNQN